jgi:uncharacterized protein (DUF427 family)
MPQAIWNGTVVAEGDRFETIEGNIYFPPESLKRNCFKASVTRTICSWKGTASYFTVAVGDAENPDAAWTYPDPKPAAKAIAGYVAFWRGIEVRP